MSKPTAVILGCSTGTGAACVRRFAESGCNVVGFHLGRHVEEADRVFADASTRGGWVKFFAVDAGSSYEAVEKAASSLKVIVGDENVNVFVHALSGASIGTTLGSGSREIERTFNLMAHSFLWWTQALLKRDLLVAGASLIALTNPLPQFYLNGSGVVGPAKAALETYVRHLAVELGPRIVHVNAIRFSTVMTPALEKVLGEHKARMRKLHERIVPVGRMQTADEVAALAVHLGWNPWCNGAVIDYTGGSTATLLDYAFRG